MVISKDREEICNCYMYMYTGYVILENFLKSAEEINWLGN